MPEDQAAEDLRTELAATHSEARDSAVVQAEARARLEAQAAARFTGGSRPPRRKPRWRVAAG